MADIAFYYPTQAGATDAWEPSLNRDRPVRQPRRPGVLTKIMADRKTTVSYQVADSGDQYEFEFRVLPDADYTSLNAFVAAVLGASFELLDPRTGGLVAVKFDPAFLEEMPWVYDALTQTWSITVPLRTA